MPTSGSAGLAFYHWNPRLPTEADSQMLVIISRSGRMEICLTYWQLFYLILVCSSHLRFNKFVYLMSFYEIEEEEKYIKLKDLQHLTISKHKQFYISHIPQGIFLSADTISRICKGSFQLKKTFFLWNFHKGGGSTPFP